ncbi:MAG: chemotaxis protein [Phenylobacterium sp.]|nr:chemotaxis protein [Phenylobacterium sp.]
MFRTIRQKVTVASIMVLTLCLASGGAGLWVASSLSSALDRSARSAEVLRQHMEADMMHDALRADVLSAFESGNPAMGIHLEDVRKDLAEHEGDFRTAIKSALAQARHPAVRQALAKLDDPLDAYIRSAHELVELAATDPAGASGRYGEFSQKFKALEISMDAASREIDVVARGDAAAATRQAAFGRTLMLGAIGIGALFAFGLMIVARRSIVSPIKALTEDMRELAAGNTDLALQGAQRRDEIGDIGRAVRGFQEVVVAKARNEAEEAERRRRAESEAEEKAQAERLARAQAQNLVVESLAEGLQRLAEGKLDYRITEAFDAEYEKLRSDFNGAIGRMEDTLRTIIGACHAMRSGAAEIRGATGDLSQRTEQQAASLEETAAALDEITATVGRAAEGAAQAQSAVAASKAEAESSGQVVRQAVTAMDAIERSAQQISQIIGVIDEIAFQTNLLALNAGVEAARAGDSGRGFAVVASEVRALAQRSADAAKEIKALISTSGAQVAQGVTLVGQAGAALERIVSEVDGIHRLVSDISASAGEQSTGLQQVNTAVNQMDQMTQQNAAMVEQSAAATAALNDQAEQLFALMGRFQVGRAATESQPQLRRAS